VKALAVVTVVFFGVCMAAVSEKIATLSERYRF